MANIFENFDEDENLSVKTQDEALLPTEYTAEKSLKSIKLSILAAFVLSLVALAGAGYLYFQFNAEKQERSAIEAGQKEVIANAGMLEDQVVQYKTVIERMREQIGSYAKERKEFKQEFERNQIEMSNMHKKVQTLEDRNKKVQAETSQIRDQLNMKETELSTAQVELTETATELTEAREQLVAAETTIEQTAVKTPSKPEVLSVNRKYNFAVVNLGKNDGVRIGDKLNVFREGKPVGLVQVEKLYDNFTAATIVKESRENAIQQGDAIRLGS